MSILRKIRSFYSCSLDTGTAEDGESANHTIDSIFTTLLHI